MVTLSPWEPSPIWAATAGVRWRAMRHHSGGRGVLVGQRAGRVIGRGGGAQQLVGGDAGARHRGQPLGQQRGELVVADLRGEASRAAGAIP